MDLKRLVTQFAYRIEAKPGSGFMAHASDPSAPVLEAPTREELQKKIQERILATLSAEFPGLKLPLDGSQKQLAFHIERSPGGGFSIHSADPNAEVIHAATEKEFENHFLEKLLGFAGKALMPEFAQAISTQIGSGNIKVVVNRQSFRTANSNEVSLRLAKTLPPKTGSQPGTTDVSAPTDTFASSQPGNLGGMIDNSPITPEPSNFGKFLRLLPAVMLILALVYFLLLRLR
jgi:hypothetical protein